MSRQGEKCKKDISDLQNTVDECMSSGKKELLKKTFDGLVDIIGDLNMRIQVLEQDLGPSDAFVNPNEGSHPVK